jgi:putative acyl-CoA dehydrogenase
MVSRDNKTETILSAGIEPASTHLVFNQSPPFVGYNAFTDDPLMQRLSRGLPQQIREQLAAHGQWAGCSEAHELARLANRHVPVLNCFDAKGNRIDQVEFHPAWHELMRQSILSGMHASCWEDSADEQNCRYFARAIRYYLTAGVEMGHLCPITMTNACVAALMKSPNIAQQWLPRIVHREYDPRNLPALQKRQILLGMGMTEKQGGTDVRTNTTRAEPGGHGNWHLTGHKWFMSAPQADAFLVLAQMSEGLGCFLVPRLSEEGNSNGLRFQRLKDKLGNRSNASSEVEFERSRAELLGLPGRGVQTIIEMVTLTRLDCAVASSGLMRIALWEAVEHCRHRKVMGQPLIDQPLMRSVLADMALDMVAATVLSMRLACAFDHTQNSVDQSGYARLMTPVIKYWCCKIAPGLVYEAMECLGGNGYVEEGDLARHYREAPLNAIWEGSGNVMCLDVIRVLGRHEHIIDGVLASLRDDLTPASARHQSEIERALEEIPRIASGIQQEPGSARHLTEQLALLAATAELYRLGLHAVADAFVATRLSGRWRSTYGMIDSNVADLVLDSTFP